MDIYKMDPDDLYTHIQCLEMEATDDADFRAKLIAKMGIYKEALEYIQGVPKGDLMGKYLQKCASMALEMAEQEDK